MKMAGTVRHAAADGSDFDRGLGDTWQGGQAASQVFDMTPVGKLRVPSNTVNYIELTKASWSLVSASSHRSATTAAAWWNARQTRSTSPE